MFIVFNICSPLFFFFGFYFQILRIIEVGIVLSLYFQNPFGTKSSAEVQKLTVASAYSPVLVQKRHNWECRKMSLLDHSSVSKIHKVISLLFLPHLMLDTSGAQIYSSFISYDSLMHNWRTRFTRAPVLLICDLCEDG